MWRWLTPYFSAIWGNTEYATHHRMYWWQIYSSEMSQINGTFYYNNKGFFSMVLLAICDANYWFTLFDLGQYGSNNDSRVLANLQMGQIFQDNFLHVPPNTKLQKDDLHDCPYFLLGDEIFPLKKWLMWPFPGKTAHNEERIYNYRHSRARRVIKNFFGILSACFRILQKPIRASVQNVEKYILAYLSFHNYLRLTYNEHYTPAGFIDLEDKHGNFVPGEWRLQSENVVQCDIFQSIIALWCSRSRVYALEVRNWLKNTTLIVTKEVFHGKLIMFAEHLFIQCDKNLIWLTLMS